MFNYIYYFFYGVYLCDKYKDPVKHYVKMTINAYIHRRRIKYNLYDVVQRCLNIVVHKNYIS